MSAYNLNNTVHRSVAVNLTSSHLLSCFKLFLYALLRYTEFFALCISLLLFPAVLLSFIRSLRQWCRCWISYELCCVWVWVWGQMWCLCFVITDQHSNLLFLLQRPYISRPLSFPALPISPCHSWVCVSPLFRLTFTWSLSSNFSEKVNAGPLAAAESALMLFCQPRPASLLSFILSVSSLPPSLALSLTGTSHQVATHSSITDSLQLWHHTTLHEPSYAV